MDFEVSLHEFAYRCFFSRNAGVLLVNGHLDGTVRAVVQHLHGFGPTTLGELSIHPCVAMVSYGAGAFDRLVSAGLEPVRSGGRGVASRVSRLSDCVCERF